MLLHSEVLDREGRLPREVRFPLPLFSLMPNPLAYIGLVNSRGFVKTYVPIHADIVYIGEYVSKACIERFASNSLSNLFLASLGGIHV